LDSGISLFSEDAALLAFRRRKYHRIAKQMNKITIKGTATPIPTFAPVERPLFDGVDVGAVFKVEEEVGEGEGV
jgi:hypothetical protein